jgi:WD40 repeat protein
MSDALKVKALKPKLHLELDDYVTNLVWTGNSGQIAATTAAGTLYWIDSLSGKVTGQCQAHRGSICQLALLHDKKKIISTGQDGMLKFWSLGTDQPEKEIELGKKWIEHLAVGGGSERNFLAVAAGKHISFLTGEGKETRPKAELAFTVSGLAWQQQTGDLLAASYGGLHVYSPKKGTLQPIKKYEWKGAFWCCSYSPEGRWVAGATQEKAVHIWEAKSAEHLHMPGYPAKVKCMQWTPDSHWLITAAGMDLLLWDCSGQGPCGREPKFLAAHAATIEVCAAQKKGNFFASADEKGRLILWNADLPEEAALAAAYAGEAAWSAVAWSPDDTCLAAGGADGSFYLF